jgi:hypothetical protein
MSELAKHIKRLAKSPYSHIQQATVVSVDEGKRTCVVNLLVGDVEIPDVRLTAVEDEAEDFFVMLPKVDSLVWIAFADESHEAVVIAVSVVTKTVFNGGKQKGMPLLTPLERELNKLHTKIDSLKTAIGTAIAVYSGILDGGSSANTFNSVQLPKADLKDLENKKLIQ